MRTRVLVADLACSTAHAKALHLARVAVVFFFAFVVAERTKERKVGAFANT